MVGGNAVETSKTQVKNNPYVPNQRRDINKQRYSETVKNQPPPKPQDPLVDLKVYPPKPNIPPKKDIPTYPSPYPFNVPIGYSTGLSQPLVYPLIQNYTVSTADPSMDFTRVNMVFEDVLPIRENQDTSATITERSNIVNFVRGVLLRKSDGESISLNGKDRGGLLSYLKFMELNPYHSHPHYNNIFKSLPSNFLIYRTAYPIRYSPENGSLICAVPSVGINVRIYRLNMDEANVRATNGQNYYMHDVWREIAYYEHIREKIFKNKVCPNFVILYAYYISENEVIDFDTVNRIREGVNPNKNYFMSSRQPKYVMEKSDGLVQTTGEKENVIYNKTASIKSTLFEVETLKKEIKDLELLLKKPELTPIQIQELKNLIFTKSEIVRRNSVTYDINGKPIIEMYPNPLADSGKILIALTEAPTNSLLSWASKQYQKDVNLRRMINQGLYSENVWYSVLFQLLAAFCVLQKEKIYIRNMKISDSVFIKDLRIETFSAGWWKYIIDQVDYYVPNHGYLVQIDTSYKDIPYKNSLVNFDDRTETKSNKFKIYTNLFSGDSLGMMAYNEEQLSELCHKNFCNIINTDNFSTDFVNMGGIKPPESILRLIGNINREAVASGHKTQISQYIYTYMRKFVNNRIGEYLLKKEIDNILYYGNKNFKKGDMVVFENNKNDDLVWVMFMEEEVVTDIKLGTINKARVLTKDKNEKNEIIDKVVLLSQLLPYNKGEKIEQILKPHEPKYSEEDLLETYIMN